MLTKDKILEFLENHQDELHHEYHIKQIGLIGSFARNEQTESSDVDFIIEFESNTKDIYDLKINLRNFLKSHLNREVDICRLKYIKPFIKTYLEHEVIYV